MVIVNKRNPCPKCLPFCGKVLIDDVWSGGRKDGVDPGNGKKYPLMSYAVSKGLYHPRCKDSHTTYFPGISTADDTWTQKELEDIGLAAKQEAKQRYAERQVEKFDRLAKYSLDEENRGKYQVKSDEWNARVESLKKLSSKDSNVAWNDLLGLEQEQFDRLNNIHSALNEHMLENATEKAVFFGLEENAVLAQDIGQAIDEVVLSKETIQILKNCSPNGIIFSHVHPSETGFSRADIDKIINYKSIKALTLECPDGTKYILDRGNYKAGLFAYHKYDKAFFEAEQRAQKMFPEFETGNLEDLERIWSEYVDKRNQILSEKLGMTYRKVKTGEE